MKYITVFLLILCIIFVFLYFYSIEPFENKMVLNVQDYRNFIMENDNKTLIKPKLFKNAIETEDCALKCNDQDCIKLNEMKRNFENCQKCTLEGKCFHKTIIGGNCDDCQPDEKPMDCARTDNFGCTNPNNLNSFQGTAPYYIEIADYNVYSPFDQKCVFCWQLENEI